LWPLIALTGGAIAVASGARGCYTPSSAAAIAPAIEVADSAPPKGSPVFVGVLITGYMVDVAPKVEGKLEAVFFHEGDRVKKGTALANVDLHRTRQDLAIAEADLVASYAQEHDAELKLRRRIPLGGSAISREEVDSARAQAQVARAKVESGKKRVEQLKLAEQDSELRSPFDGVVVTVYLDPGALAGPGRPVLRLLGASQPQVRFAVPEEHARELAVGRLIHVTVPPLRTTLDATIDRFTPEVDTGSRMLFATGNLDLSAELQGRISSGVEVRVSLADTTAPEASAATEPTDDAAPTPSAVLNAPPL
jgi:RND family efflux transporter MFP subunit